MAERKSGPVKPPVIDLTARPAGEEASAAGKPAEPAPEQAEAGKLAAKPEAKPDAKPEAAKEPPAGRAKPPGAGTGTGPAAGATAAPGGRRPVDPWRAGLAGGVGGAIVAIAVCYGLAAAGYWPSAATPPDPTLTTRLDQSDKSIADLDARLTSLQTDSADKLNSLASALQGVQDSVAKLQTASAPAPDLGPIRDQLKTLSSRLDAVAAGASSADAGALAANVASLQQNSTVTQQKFTTLDGQVRDLADAVASLKSELDAAKGQIAQAAAAPSKQAIASALQLPLLISALEADFAAGRPYQADLSALTKALPEAHVPASVSDAAATGLPAPGDLAAAFEARMPAMIAALPPSTDTSLTGQLGDWVRNVFAVRRQAPEAGDSPEARLSQAEAAVGRHDFAGAVKLIDQLPDRVKAAGGEVIDQLKAAAEADSFIAGLRQTALAPASGEAAAAPAGGANP
ncbi:MAG TPA: hypothetical protein VHB74_03720 [Devosia sp.]|nr:hypothetical protein [Devosia sp.]